MLYIEFMSEDKLLKKVGELIVANNEVLLSAIDKKNDSLKKELTKKIQGSQADTIEVLSDLLHTGYNMHEERIQRVENELHLPPLKQ